MERKARKIRFSENEERQIQMLADLYADGNFSEWVRWASINAPRKVLNKKSERHKDTRPKR